MRKWLVPGAFVLALIFGMLASSPEPGGQSLMAVQARPMATQTPPAGCVDTYFTRTCPDDAEYCGTFCSWVINPLNLSLPTCGVNQVFQLFVSMTEACDDDIYSASVALYDGHGFMGGGNLNATVSGYVQCIGSRVPTAAVISWIGMPPSGNTKGPKAIRFRVCCTVCE